MLSASLYAPIYISVIAILTIWCMAQYSTYPVSRVNEANHKQNLIPSLILIIIVTFFIGFRPLSGVFVDMLNYFVGYEKIYDNEAYFVFDKDAENFLFDNLFDYMAIERVNVFLFFFLIAVIYFGCMFVAIKKIFPNDLFYAVIIYLGAFSTFSYGTNGIKAGAAASIFLLVFAFYRKPLIAVLFCFISLGFHHSMMLVIYSFVLAYFVKNPKWFFVGWIICLFLSTLHISGITEFLSVFADDSSTDRYLNASETGWGGKEGFRWDFILYSLPPIAIGYWTIFKKGICDRLYQLLLCTYLAANGAWMLCMYIPFNNRIAYMSWFMLPILIAYPFLKFKLDFNQYKQLNWVVAVYLAFTIFSNWMFF